MKFSLKIPPYLEHVATLPCEIFDAFCVLKAAVGPGCNTILYNLKRNWNRPRLWLLWLHCQHQRNRNCVLITTCVTRILRTARSFAGTLCFQLSERVPAAILFVVISRPAVSSRSHSSLNAFLLLTLAAHIRLLLSIMPVHMLLFYKTSTYCCISGLVSCSSDIRTYFGHKVTSTCCLSTYTWRLNGGICCLLLGLLLILRCQYPKFCSSGVQLHFHHQNRNWYWISDGKYSGSASPVESYQQLGPELLWRNAGCMQRTWRAVPFVWGRDTENAWS